MQKAGPWTLGDRLGGGAFGEVFVATHPSLPGEYAVKLADKRPKKGEKLPAKSRESMASIGLNRERLALMVQLGQHPSIVKMAPRDMFGETETHKYLATELLGASLGAERRAQPSRKLPVARVARVAADLVPALAHIHRRGFVYADLKPDNIAVRESEGRFVLIDFGCVHPIRSFGTQRADIVGVVEGTPLYISAFVERGEPVAARNDLESLAFVLADLATGTLPWRDARNDDDMGRAKQAASVEEICAGLPREFADFLRAVRAMPANKVLSQAEAEALAAPFARLAGRPESAARLASAARPAPIEEHLAQIEERPTSAARLTSAARMASAARPTDAARLAVVAMAPITINASKEEIKARVLARVEVERRGYARFLEAEQKRALAATVLVRPASARPVSEKAAALRATVYAQTPNLSRDDRDYIADLARRQREAV